MQIEPLSPSTLKASIAVADQVFPYQGLTEKASYAFRLSLISGWWPRLILQIIEVCYWVAVEDGKVLGTTGLYGYAQDFHEAYWLGWTCVAPVARGRGIGGKLVDHAIAQARQSDKTILRLYTSTHPNEAIAQTLYESRGFKIFREQPISGTPYQRIYRELNLRT